MTEHKCAIERMGHGPLMESCRKAEAKIAAVEAENTMLRALLAKAGDQMWDTIHLIEEALKEKP